MPRPDPKRPREGQEALFEAEAVKQPDCVLRGRHSMALDAALDAARENQVIHPIDEGIATVLRAGAWALDTLEKQDRPYGPAKLIPAMTEALTAAHMTPESRKLESEDLAKQLFEDLAALESGDDA